MDNIRSAKEVQPHSREQLVAFLKDKFDDHMVCPYCSNESWTVYTMGDAPGISFFSTSFLVDGKSTLHLPHYSLSCDNCANIWQIAFTIVDSWIKESVAPKAEVDSE